MNRIALIAAVAAGIGGALLLAVHKQNFERSVTGGAPVPVLVAATDVALGEELTEDLLAIREIPEAYVEDRHIRAEDASRVVGVRTSMSLSANDSILWSDLASASSDRRHLSGLVGQGLRAVSVRPANADSFGGLLRPGDRVDVLFTSERIDSQVTVPLLQNVLVLAVGGDTGAEAGNAASMRNDSVTLSATVAQAQVLAHAEVEGVVTLVLRNPNDITVVEQMPETTRDDLLDSDKLANIQSRRVRRVAPAPSKDEADAETKEIEHVR